MTPQEREILLDRLWRRIIVAHGVILRRIGEKLPELYKIRLSKAEQDNEAATWREAARGVLEIVEEAGYTLPPKNDLRGQLIKAARELKANTWHRGYSDPDNIDSRAEEARYDAISDVGHILLDALTDNS